MQKVALGVVMVMMATTLVLPGRQSPAIVANFFKGTTSLAKAATGR